MLNNESYEQALPWYKQFWPWFLISIPLSAVVAGIITIYISIQSKDDLVNEQYYKRGIAINHDFAQAKRAHELNLEGDLSIDAKQHQLKINLSQDIGLNPLTLRFRHAAFEKHDFSLTVTPINSHTLITPKPNLAQGKWYIYLESTEQSWLLRGRLNWPEQNQLILQPYG